jgi:hypothetical protein
MSEKVKRREVFLECPPLKAGDPKPLVRQETLYGSPIYGELVLRLCSPFNFVQGDPEFIEGSPP